MGGALPFRESDFERFLTPAGTPGGDWLFDFDTSWETNRILPPSRMTSGPYRHAYGLSSTCSWTLKGLAAVADSMIEGENGLGRAPRPDVDALPSAYTYFGQFVVHDLSRMTAEDPFSTALPACATLSNRCRPRLDLQSLYGLGPLGSPALYALGVPGAFGSLAHWLARWTPGRQSGPDDDLQRNQHEQAVLAEPRNDENVMVSQIHLAFLKAHNRLLEETPLEPGWNEYDRFLFVRRALQWHVQWLVLNDFLQRVLHRDQATELCSKLCEFAAGRRPVLRFAEVWRDDPYLPLEFVLAAFRFGHALVRPEYGLNRKVRDPIRLMPVEGTPDDGHLGGGRKLPRDWTLDWGHFCDDKGADWTQFARPFSTNVSASLGALPFSFFRVGEESRIPDEQLAKLPFLTLMRGALFGLPTGQELAAAVARYDPRIVLHDSIEEGRAPLWYYLLAEAGLATEGAGRTLGRLGSTIVLDTLLGLIASDSHSYLNLEPGWQPFLGHPQPGKRYSLGTLLRYAWPKSHGGDVP